MIYPETEDKLRHEILTVNDGIVLMYAGPLEGFPQFMGRYNARTMIGIPNSDKGWPSFISLELHTSQLMGRINQIEASSLTEADLRYGTTREARMYAAAAALSAIRRQNLDLSILYAVAILNGKVETGIKETILFTGIDIAKVAGMSRETASRQMADLRSSGKVTRRNKTYFIAREGHELLDLQILEDIVNTFLRPSATHI